jgi:hypothetical protein
VATSLKSIDLHASSYQSTRGLKNRVERDVMTLAAWDGGRIGGISIDKDDIRERVLLLVIPKGASRAQKNALRELEGWARRQGVTLRVEVIA